MSNNIIKYILESHNHIKTTTYIISLIFHQALSINIKNNIINIKLCYVLCKHPAMFFFSSFIFPLFASYFSLYIYFKLIVGKFHTNFSCYTNLLHRTEHITSTKKNIRTWKYVKKIENYPAYKYRKISSHTHICE